MLARRLCFDGKEMRLVETELRTPTGSQVLVRAEYSNISIGTETVFIAHASENGEPAPPLGYSLVGIVEQAGPAAGMRVGQRVLALEPHAGAVLVEASPRSLTPVPPGLDPALASLGTVASVAIHIVQRANLRLGESALVFGHGLVGALLAQLVKLGGASWVGVVEPDQARRKLAQALGADAVLNPSQGGLCEALAQAGYDAGVDVVFEAAGHPSVFPTAFQVLRIGGRLVCSSTFLGEVQVPLYPVIVDKELTLIGAHQVKCPPLRVPYYPHSQFDNRRWALQLLAEGRVRGRELITHVIPWEEAPAFYDRLRTDRSIFAAVIQWTAPERGDD